MYGAQTGIAAAVHSALTFIGGWSSPAKLFANNEQGAWYDPQDYGTSGFNGVGTLYQDSAGTTPVTAVEQPVGLMLDKRKGLVLGSELVTNGDFSSGTGWTVPVAGASITGGALTFDGVTSIGAGVAVTTNTPVSSIVAGKWYRVTYTIVSGTTLPVSMSVGGTTTAAVSAAGTYSEMVLTTTTGAPAVLTRTSIGARTGSIDNISVKLLDGNHAYQSTSAARPTLRARYNLLVGTATLSTQSITTVAANYTLTFTGSGSITLSGTATGTYTAGTSTFTATAGALTVTVTGTVNNADIRPTNQIGTGLPSYQRVTTSTDYDTVGFPVYIQGNGSSQFMLTSAIDFSGTDKMTVWSAVRKLSDAAQGTVMELGTDSTSTSNGAFALFAPASAAANYGFQLRGTAYTQYRATTFTAPVSNVLSVLYDIAGALIANEVFPRVNAAVPSLADVGGASAGTGNFGNHALYILSRAGSSLWFGGYFYGAIIRGAASNEAQIQLGERYLQQRSLAY